MLNLVLFGGPGSGKGTQSARLIDDFGLYHISTGELLRDHIKRDTELGRIAASYINQGNLIPDELMVTILEEVLDHEPKVRNGVVFDGFPRTIAQAEALQQVLRKRDTDLHGVIGLEVPEDELTRRLLKRAEIEGRADDNAETIRKRLDVYHNQTSPLAEYYRKEGKYMPINGIGVVDEIYADIAAAIEKKTGRRRRR